MIRGDYVYSRRSELLDRELAPDIDQIAHALARKFGWRIQPGGPLAQNVIGLSARVPASFVYLSDGPSRSYKVNNTTLAFKHTASKETSLKLRESALRSGPQVTGAGADHALSHREAPQATPACEPRCSPTRNS